MVCGGREKVAWDDDVGRTSSGVLLELAIWEIQVEHSVVGEGAERV